MVSLLRVRETLHLAVELAVALQEDKRKDGVTVLLAGKTKNINNGLETGGNSRS